MSQRLSPWLPKSALALRHYSLATFRADAIAGVTVGLVALPLAMAFAIASGLTPQAGIYCAVVTGFLISALGGSMVQIGGPTGAFVVVVAGIVAQYGVVGPVHLHDDGRRHPGSAWRDGHRERRAIHSTSSGRGLHERYRSAHREHANPRFSRPTDDGEPRRIRCAPCSDWTPSRHDRSSDRRPGDAHPRPRPGNQSLRQVVPGTIVGLVGGTAIAWAGRSADRHRRIAFRRLPSGLPVFHIPRSSHRSC